MGVIRIQLLSLGVALVAAACGSEPGGIDPSIAVSLSADSLSLQRGGVGSITAAITRNGGFTGNVNVQVVGAPTGVTASVANLATSGTTTTGTVNIAVDSSFSPRIIQFAVRASGSGVSDVVAFIVLTVPRAPTIDLSFDQNLSVSVGQTRTVQFTIERIGLTGNVTLALEGPVYPTGPIPAGVTWAFAPNPTATNASTLTIGVDSAVAAGDYELSVRATAPGGFASNAYEFFLTVSRP